VPCQRKGRRDRVPARGPTARMGRRIPGVARPVVVVAAVREAVEVAVPALRPVAMAEAGARKSEGRGPAGNDVAVPGAMVALDAPVGKGHTGNVRPGTSGVGLPAESPPATGSGAVGPRETGSGGRREFRTRRPGGRLPKTPVVRVERRTPSGPTFRTTSTSQPWTRKSVVN